MTDSIEIEIPEELAGKVTKSPITGNYSQSGKITSYEVEVQIPELSLCRHIKSRDLDLLANKIETQLRTWVPKYLKHLENLDHEESQERAEELTREAEKAQQDLAAILSHTLSVNDEVDWDRLRRADKFRPDPDATWGSFESFSCMTFKKNGEPSAVTEQKIPEKPSLDDAKADTSLLRRLLTPGKVKRLLDERLDAWKDRCESIAEVNSKRKVDFGVVVKDFAERKRTFEARKQEHNTRVGELQNNYLANDPEAIRECCDLVLSASQYPPGFPQDWDAEFRPEAKLLVVDYQLPAPSDLPTSDSFKYIKSKRQLVEKKLSATASKKQYDSVIYQVCIRTIHELFESDTINAIETVAFNGIVDSVSPATGLQEAKTIITVSAEKQEFLKFDLSRVEPKQTFKKLKGISASSLQELTPVAPVISIEKHDKRFVEEREAISGLDPSTNLAAMDWEEFEHLVREIFEAEFAEGGGEVRVTQSSSDGGVDAIAFDPDPIRGGKIVIQAKRYTNIVGVAAVRDLYGTVMNEGATKGILVTTSDYGRDSYEFIKNKPLSLITGSNLLSLLEKHGHKAKIDIAEAKLMRQP